jgi:hypothetical protein
MELVLELVRQERQAQERRYGKTNHRLVSGTGPETRWLLPYTFDSAEQIQKQVRYDYEDWEADGSLPTWAHLVREEIAEAFQEPDGPELIAELIQVAALCVSWVERLIPKETHE